MKSIRIAGLCLAAVFVMSMAAAGTASAAPHWLVCLNWGGTGTKYSENQCFKAEGTGKYEWAEVKGTEPVASQGSVTLVTNGVPIVGSVEVKCSGIDEGSVGPGNIARTTEIPKASIKCVAGKNCEKLIKNAVPVGLPWNTELKETEGVLRGTIRKGAGSTSAPGWTAECTVLGVTEANTCTTEEGLVNLTNTFTPGTVGPLLVLANFIKPNKPEAKCTRAGTTGDVLGGISILLANGDGLRVSP